jgi:Leucine-rich repeat (LRR) protein
MKLKLLFLLFLASSSSFAQYTLIPDAYFETELIRQGIDSGTPDGKVLTSKINTLTTLNVRGVSFIADLTGIQDFTALKSLLCDTNQLTALDVSKNTALTYLSFGDNYLTTIDVSKNIALTELRCYHNLLTTLDVSKNTALTILHCYENQLKTLDFSKNTALTYLDCSDNELTGLNLKNGNNSKLSTNSAFNSNNLSCIQVDNVAYANANWTAKDAEASYSLDCSVVVQYTLIPDVNFEKRLIQLGYDFGTPDGKVPTSKISGVTTLNISGSSITNLTGIQDFAALQLLDCSNNQLTALDFSKNIALTNLSCNSNQLTTLDVSKNTALTYIYCYSNKLTALDVSKNAALTNLYCYSNQLTALDVSKNIALTNLNCYSNQLTSLNVSQNAALKELHCYSNKLTSFDISKSIALTKLYCYSNQLTALDVSKNTALIYLYCYENQLTALDASKNTVLRYIDCSSNQLTSLNAMNGRDFSTYNFKNNPNLDCIQVDHIYYYDNYYKDAVATYSRDCSRVLIPDVNFEKKLISLGIDSGTVDGQVPGYKINTLTSLDVSNSSIADLTGIQSFVGLNALNCSGNELTALDVSKNTLLGSLNCSSNQLTNLNLKNGNYLSFSTKNFKNNPNLSCIQVDNVVYANTNWLAAKDAAATYKADCADVVQYTLIPDADFEKKLILLGHDSGTPDGKVPTINISSLTSLNLFASNITDLTGIQDFVALKSLTCAANEITALDFSKNIALSELDCGRNQLTTLNVSKNTALTVFACDSNQLTALDISKNVSLRYVRCYSNKLISLDVSKNTALESLYCYSNSLTALDVSKNTALIEFECYSNQLTSLNVQNGNNINFVTNKTNYTKNPNLRCIQVDNVTYSNDNLSWSKDATASYNTNCPLLVVAVSSEFENKLIALGIDTDGKNGSVLLASITNVTSLDVSNSGITSLSGIEYFSKLETLNCQGNLLTSINVSSNPALKYLDCSKNPLSALDVTKNPQLSELYCDGIATTTKKINAKTSVANQLTALDVSKNLSLTKLSCANNQLVSLDVSKNVLLTDLNCSNNSLQTLKLSNGNNAKLSNVNFKTNASLSCVQVDDVAYSNANWSAAKDATASYSNNCLAVVAVNSEFENKLIALGIDTDGKNGSVLLASITNVISLDVSNSGIISLSGIEYFSKLETINCQGNLLTSINVSSNPALKYLDCSKNPLSALDVTKNPQLSELYCDGIATTTKKINAKTSVANQLTALDVSKNLSLTKLSCANNQLVSLDVSKNVLLTDLNCSNNNLQTLNLSNGNNAKLSNVNFKTNASLSCIQVDDVAYSNANWSAVKDATASYSNNCLAVVAVNSEFENKLIALGIDTDGKNGSVLLASITNVTSLDVSNSGVTSLSGIEYFSKLETINCQGNLLTLINVSSNPALKYLDCSKNPLSALDVTKNRQLSELYCDGIATTTKKINAKTSVANQLTALDVSKNLSLTKLSCANNQLVSLDVSKNVLLTDLNCSNNSLQTLNLSNSNNTKLSNVNFKTNASLSCIQVDDVAYSNANWSAAKEAIATYSKTACTLGIPKSVFDTIAVYPNPTKGEIHIDNCVVEKARVYDTLGKLVTTKTFTEGSNNNTINLAGFPRGIYYIYLESAGATSVKKIVVE